MRRIVIPLAVGCCAGAIALVCLPGAASADAPLATAWWHVLRQQTPVGALPGAPVPGNGALPVQNGPAGVLAFSAVRFDVGAATAGTLALAFASPAPASPPAVDLCLPTTHWTDGADQEWDARPAYSCTTHVAGSAANGSVTWPISSALVRDGELDVVLVPDPSDPTPYAVAFAQPSGTALAMAPPQQPFTGPAAPAANVPAAAAAASGAQVPPGLGVASVAASPAAPVVAASPGQQAAPLPSTSARADRPARDKRAVGAVLLAGLSAALLLSGLVTGRHRTGRSLLARAPATSVDR